MRAANTWRAVLATCVALAGHALGCEYGNPRFVVASPVRVHVESRLITKGLRVQVFDPSRDFKQVKEAVTDDKGLASISLLPGDYFLSAKGSVLSGSGADLTVVKSAVNRVLDEQVPLGFPFFEHRVSRLARGTLGPLELYSPAQMKLFREPGGTLVAESTTDARGVFDFGQVQEGIYAIQISFAMRVPSSDGKVRESPQTGHIALQISRDADREDLRMNLKWTSCGFMDVADGDAAPREPEVLKSSCGLEVRPETASLVRVVSDDGIKWVEIVKEADGYRSANSAQVWLLNSGAAFVALQRSEHDDNDRRLWDENTQYCFFPDGSTRISSQLLDHRGSLVYESLIVDRTWQLSLSASDQYKERAYDDKNRQIFTPEQDLRTLMDRLPVYRQLTDLPFYSLIQAHAQTH